MPKVSIVVPIYNVEKYLRQCLDSVVSQTLSDIEIICVNDGSTDSSLEIINEYADKDPRIKVINKQNSGYGNTMNCGFNMASGEYIGIVESDDYCELDMFERLYNCAKVNDLDVCKGNFYYYFSSENENIKYNLPKASLKKGVFRPTTDFNSLRAQVEFFNIKPTIWSAIYKKEFIRENNIRFNETPGASFQDTSFNFKVWALASRVMLIDMPFIHYRQDNEMSSMNSSSKVYCVIDEYHEIERFLSNRKNDGNLISVKNALKFRAYIWNYERLETKKAEEFLLCAVNELENDIKDIALKGALSNYEWKKYNFIVSDPRGFHQKRQEEKKDEKPFVEGKAQGGKIKRLVNSIKENGLGYTIKKAFRKLK